MGTELGTATHLDSGATLGRKIRNSLESIAYRLGELIKAVERLPADSRSADVNAGLSILQAAVPKFGVLQGPRVPRVKLKPRSRNRRGPKTNTKRHAALKAIAANFGDDWGQGVNLRKICKAADAAKIVTPKTWNTESWEDMMNQSPTTVRSTVSYSIQQANRQSLGI